MFKIEQNAKHFWLLIYTYQYPVMFVINKTGISFYLPQTWAYLCQYHSTTLISPFSQEIHLVTRCVAGQCQIILWLGLWWWHQFKQYFSDKVVRNFVVCAGDKTGGLAAMRGRQFYWWRKPEFPEKNPDLSQVTDKFYYSVVSSTPRHERDSNSQR